jgi:alkylhydroperoxidase family enzyme
MARLPYIEESQASERDLKDIYQDITRLRGRILNLHRLLANQPPALRAFMTMSRYIRDEADLPGDLRELSILMTAHHLGVQYEWIHHVPMARRQGLSEGQIREVAAWHSSGLFDERQRAVLDYAERVARTKPVTDDCFGELRSRLPVGQIVDLILTVAWYHFCAAIIKPTELDVENADG